MDSKARKSGATAVARVQTCEQSARAIATMFGECFADEKAAISIVDNGQGDWTVVLYFHHPADTNAVRAMVSAAAGARAAKTLRFDRLAANDWVRKSLRHLPAVRAGRFVIHGAHDRTAAPLNRIGIEIEAALAFGTGHHASTRGCLLALDAICKAPNLRTRSLRSRLRVTEKRPRILDLGTGSGVLAIAAARAFHLRVLATDVDGQAVRVARANAWLNGAGSLIETVKADGVADGRILARAPFDLVFANILLAPLQSFAAALTPLVAPGGRIVLSGLLRSQGRAALSAYRSLRLERRIELDEWTTLVLRRGGNKRRAGRAAPAHRKRRI